MNTVSRFTLVTILSSCSLLALRGADAEPAYTGKAYAGVIPELPGVVEAELYDYARGGAPDIAWHYNGKPSQTPWRIPADSIGLGVFGDDHMDIEGRPEKPGQVYVGWTHVGEWWRYTVKVTQGGTYKIGGHFASATRDAQLRFTFVPKAGGAPIETKPLPIPTTAGYLLNVEVYHVWETLDRIGEVTLPAGDYVMKVELMNQAGMNLDRFAFTLAK
jgi:hypothetical protein